MAKVLGFHRIELKPGADEQEFERLVTGSFIPLYSQADARQSATLIKGERGERAGKYALLIEIESPEARDAIYPGEGQLSAAFQEVIDANGGLFEKLGTLVERFPDDLYTDYVVIGG